VRSARLTMGARHRASGSFVGAGTRVGIIGQDASEAGTRSRDQASASRAVWQADRGRRAWATRGGVRGDRVVVPADRSAVARE